MSYAEPLSGMMGSVARELLGTPNKRMSNGTALRFGTNGSVEVNTAEGWFADYERDVRGGVLDLIAHKAGITDRAAAFRWLEERGHKEPSSGIKEPPSGRSRARNEVYDYRDESGEVLFKVVRHNLAGRSKTFAQHGPDGQGGFASHKGCMQGVRRVLYRLPELIAADPAVTVFICEGEKDADRLAREGLVATTNPGGAGKFRPEFAPALAGRRVVVLADNDEPGRKHAADVEAKLEGVAFKVAVLSLPGGDKSDVSDWLDNGGTAPDLERMAAEALSAHRLPLPTLDLAALAEIAPAAKAFAIEGFVPLAEVTIFPGPGGVGKSLLAQQLATTSAAAIGHCLGLRVQPSPALYITCEDDAGQLHYRQKHICEALGVDMASIAGKLHLVSLRGELGNELGTFGADGTYKPSPTYHRLVGMIEATGSKLVFLDNVAHLFTGNENDRSQVTHFINLLNRLAGQTGAAIVVLAHPNKAGAHYSGSTAWMNAVRSQIAMDWVKDKDGDVPDWDARVLATHKANFDKKGRALHFRWHEWAFVLDEDLPADTRNELAEAIKVAGENEAFLRCLAAATERKRAVSHNPGVNYYAAIFSKMPEGKKRPKADFERAFERLLAIGEIEIDAKLWQRENRAWKYGIRTTDNDEEKCTDPLHQPPAPTRTDPSVNPARTDPPYTTYRKGAGPDGPPPPPESEEECAACDGAGCDWCEP